MYSISARMSALPTNISALCYKSVSPSMYHIPYTIRTREKHVYIRAQNKHIEYTWMPQAILPHLSFLYFFFLCQLPLRLTFSSILVPWCTNRFNNQKPYILSKLYLCVFFIYLRTNNESAPHHINCLLFANKIKSVYCAVRMDLQIKRYTLIL
jgi:hypothetical protein